MVFEGDRTHARTRGVDSDLDHVLGPVDKIRVGVDVAVDRPRHQLVLDPGVNGRDARVVFEHLVEKVPGVELAGPLKGQGAAQHDLPDRGLTGPAADGRVEMTSVAHLRSKDLRDQMLVAHGPELLMDRFFSEE